MPKEIHATTKPRAPETGTPVQVRLQREPLARLDAWRRDQADLPSRSEAIRRLIDIGLKWKERK